MARSGETKIELTAYDDLFQTDESREEAKLSKIRDIPISEIDEFPDHPFKVLMDEDMEQLVESIKRNGVMTPATVRLKEDGRYELISGHRRKKACELAGLETLKCEVKELTRDEAIIVMVESNLQRSVILPSEKAFAYQEYEQRAVSHSEHNYHKFANEIMSLFTELGAMKQLPPTDKAVQEKVTALQAYINDNFYTCSNDILKGLGEMYVCDDRFKKNIDRVGGEGTAEFVREAIFIYCDK